MRVPDLALVKRAHIDGLKAVGERWMTSRIGVTEATRTTHVVNLGRIIADARHEGARDDQQGRRRGPRRETARRWAPRASRSGRRSRPSRWCSTSPRSHRTPLLSVELPENGARGDQPADGAAPRGDACRLASTVRAPALMLDATGLRVGELEQLTWGASTSRRAAADRSRRRRRQSTQVGRRTRS